MIRPYAYADGPELSALHNLLNPSQPHSLISFRTAVQDTKDAGGFTWTVIDGQIAGYASINPVPGLNHIGELAGFIHPDKRRQGLGTALLQHIIEDLRGSTIKQISHQLVDQDSPVAAFLAKNQFFVEHEEIILIRENLQALDPVQSTADLKTETYSREKAISLFCQLSAQSFAGLPWDQPYSEAEVEAMLHRPEDMLFLLWRDQVIGFIWLYLEEDNLGVIEPLGILPGYQGKGFGRFLLISGLHELARRGVNRAQIGAWKENEVAIHLYESLGFSYRQTVTYLAYNLS